MRILYLDCFSGISGDMTVGALCDLGVKPSAFEWELNKLDIGDFHAHWEREIRQNIEGVKFSIHEGATHTHEQDEEAEVHHHEEPFRHAQGPEPVAGHEGHEGEHGHHHHEEHHHHEHEEEHHHHGHEEHHHDGHQHHDHPSRGYREIRALIESSTLSDFVKRHAIGIFQRIAIAEGKIHGVKPDDVTFHEVGALDSIADIVLACAGIEALNIDHIAVSPLAEGRGWIDTAHGRFPVPAPATLEILTGIPLASIDEPAEFITPTGAAIVAEFAKEFGPMPAMKIEKIGYGAGTRVHETRPNVLRAILGEAASAAQPIDGYERDTITRIETNIDDLSPEIIGAATEHLLKAGALDVFLTPIQMKKNRPAVQLTVLCEDSAIPGIAELIFRETTSFGIRMDKVDRLKLERKFEQVKTSYGEVTVKIGLLAGQEIQISPEFDSCKSLSEKTNHPVRAIYEAAVRARPAL